MQIYTETDKDTEITDLFLVGLSAEAESEEVLRGDLLEERL